MNLIAEHRLKNNDLRRVPAFYPSSIFNRYSIFCNYFLGFLILFSVLGCTPSHKELVDSIVLHPAPEFQADSAYTHIATQVGFGPRIPGLESHRRCGDFLSAKLKQYGAVVMEQHDSATVANGKRLPLRNIIGSFSPEKKERILLVTHWDSRPTSDEDPEHFNTPIDGAHDGASGVAVLLEIARLVGMQEPAVGVDIILFDTEDQGRGWEDGDTPDSEFFYCMGARHWAAHPHVSGYSARFGVMVDMVAATDAVFTLEAVSMEHAAEEMRHIWATAHRLGFEDRFRFNLTRKMVHDHFYISTMAGIPTVAIVHHDNTAHSGFGSYWHTQHDNLSTVDRAPLQAVGQTLTQVIYNAK